MKIRSFLLVIVLVICSASLVNAQSLQLSRNGEDVSNAEINVTGLSTDNIIDVSFIITNISESEISVKVRKNVIEDIEDSFNTICFGTCYLPQVTESPDPCTLNAGESTYEGFFAVDFSPEGNSGTAKIVYEVFNVDNPDDKVSVTVNFIISPTGIGVNKKDIGLQAYPNPTTGELVYVDYSLPSSVQNATFTVYNMLGVKVYEMAIENRSGKIDFPTNGFPKGIYLYSIEANGSRLATKRLIVR